MNSLKMKLPGVEFLAISVEHSVVSETTDDAYYNMYAAYSKTVSLNVLDGVLL